MTRSEIFTQAHKAAKAGFKFTAYAIRFKVALKQAYAEAKAKSVFLSPETIVARIAQIDARYSAQVSGGYIVGCYRGKSSEYYKFDIVNRVCVYDNCGFKSIITKIFTF